MVKRGIKRGAIILKNLGLVVSAIAESYAVVSVGTYVGAGSAGVDRIYALKAVSESSKVKSAVGCIILVISGKRAGSELHLGRLCMASVTLVNKIACCSTGRKNGLNVLEGVVAKSVNLVRLVCATVDTPVKSNTLVGAGRRGSDNGLGGIPRVNVGLRSHYVVLTVCLGGVIDTGCAASTSIDLVTAVLAVSLNLGGGPGVTRSSGRSYLLCATGTLVNLNLIVGAVACIVSGIGRIKSPSVRELRKSKNSVGNPLRTCGSSRGDGSVGGAGVTGNVRRKTANATTVEPEAVLGARRIAVRNRNSEVVVMLSRIYDVCLGNDVSLVEGKSVTNRALVVSKDAVGLTAVSGSINVSPGVAGSRIYKSGCINCSGAVKRNSVAGGALLVSKNTVIIAIGSGRTNINAEVVDAGSRESCDSDLGGGSNATYSVGNGNLTIGNNCSCLANRALYVTRACSTAGRSSSEIANLNPSVAKAAVGCVNNNLEALVLAVLALNDCKAGLVAVGLLYDLCNVTVACGTGGSDMVNLVVTVVIRAPLAPCRNTILAVEVGALVVNNVVLTLSDGLGLGYSTTLILTSSGLYAELVAGGSSGLYPCAPRVVAVADLGPVGNYGSLTSCTLVKIVAELTALSGNGLDKHYRSVSHSVLYCCTGAGNSLAMYVRVRLCENGNNAGDAHHNGEEKSTNSLRIVLH